MEDDEDDEEEMRRDEERRQKLQKLQVGRRERESEEGVCVCVA